MIKHMIINVSRAQYLKHSKANKFEKPPNKAREKKATLSLSAYDLYIFLPLWQQVTKKFLENA